AARRREQHDRERGNTQSPDPGHSARVPAGVRRRSSRRILRAMAKIVFIGAGSTVFARNLLGDILGHEELAGSEIALFDIDAERLETSELVARRVADTLGAPAKIRSITDRRAALDGADYAINMIQ